jgi:hypothetical protein
MEDLNESFAAVTETSRIVCECSDSGCVTQIAIAHEAYEQVRADPALFIVVPGHESPEIESIVDDRAAYGIVRKHPGLPEQVAEETDPRR